MADESATAMALAAEAEKKAQEELKKKKAEEQAMLAQYGASSTEKALAGKTAAGSQYTGARQDVESLYDQGYKNLEQLYGQQAEQQMQEALRPIEGTLARQGLLGGPSGALNEALAGAAQRIKTEGLGKLADYSTTRAQNLANLYQTQAGQLAGLETGYSEQQLQNLKDVLGANLANTQAGLDIANKYGQMGLEAALGTNKIVLQGEQAQDLAAQQNQLAQELLAAQEATKESNLAARQQAWDSQYQTLKAQLYANYRAGGYPDSQATVNANNEAIKQLGPRPTA